MDSTESNKSQYREHLVQARQKAYADFDKTVFALTGGALGISFAFIDKIIGDAPLVSPDLLQFAWSSWATSLTFVLVSFWTSTRALSKTIKRYDEGVQQPEQTGLATLTEVANGLGALLFVVGLIFMVLFVVPNLKAGAP